MMYLLGHKFGSTSNPSITWWLNAVVPGFCASRYRGVPTVAVKTPDDLDAAVALLDEQAAGEAQTERSETR